MAKIVCTTLGNSIIQERKQVFVHVAGNKFVRKNIEDLSIGDQVIYNKEFVTTSLEEVEPILDMSPRYRFAQELLHEQNNRGEFIPKQRTFLMRGLAGRGIVQSADLEARILKEAQSDFGSDEYNRMNNEVYRVINPNIANPVPITDELPANHQTNVPMTRNQNRSHAAINSWLRGQTVGIRLSDWNLYRQLDQINPEFRNFDANDSSRTGFFWNYRLYSTVRKTIMRYLADCKGERRTAGDSNNEFEREHISVAPEIRLVVNYFINDIDTRYAAARVTSIKNLGFGNSAPNSEPEPNLTSGIINVNLHEGSEITLRNSEAGSGSLETIDMREIASHYRMLDALLKSSLVSYTEAVLNSNDVSKEPAYLIAFNLSHHISELFDEKCRVRGDSDTLEKFREKTKQTFKIDVSDFIPSISENIISGSADKSLQWPEGSLMGLIEARNKLERILPKDYFEHEDQIYKRLHQERMGSAALDYKKPRDIRKEIKRSFRKKLNKLKAYGLEGNTETYSFDPRKNIFFFSTVMYSNQGVEIMTQRMDDGLWQELRKSWGKSSDSPDDRAKTFFKCEDPLNKILAAVKEDIQKNPQEYLPILKELMEKKGVTIITRPEALDIADLYGLPHEIMAAGSNNYLPSEELEGPYRKMKEEAELERKLRLETARKTQKIFQEKTEHSALKPREIYQTSSGEEILVDMLSEKERSVYHSMVRASEKGSIKGVYEFQVQQVYDVHSKNKLRRRLESLKQSSLFKIYQDMQQKSR